MMETSLDAVEQALAQGATTSAVEKLMLVLEARGREGDAVCALAARVFGLEHATGRYVVGRVEPDAMALEVDRLLHLVREQEAQIRALRAMVETAL